MNWQDAEQKQKFVEQIKRQTERDRRQNYKENEIDELIKRIQYLEKHKSEVESKLKKLRERRQRIIDSLRISPDV